MKPAALYAIPGLSPEARQKIQRNKPKSAHILKMVASVFEVSEHDILGRSRLRKIADARHVAIALHLRYVSKNCSHVGRLLNRHYASVIHSNTRVGELTETDPDFAEKYERIITKLFTDEEIHV